MTNRSEAARRAFDGITVLELGQIYNGPYAGLLMAHLGADVIKVEPPGGERLRFRTESTIETHEFSMLNSSKRSIGLDFKSDRGRDLFLELVKVADVVIENFAPGTMERLSLRPSSLLDLNPRLVYASGKGYGSGPYEQMTAMDITVQAISGTIASTGFPDGPPVKAGPAFIDFLGGVHLFGGIAAALVQRASTGKGQMVEVAMFDTVYPALASALGGFYNEPKRDVPERTGNRHSGMGISPYNVYSANDGYVAIIAVSERHFAGVAAAIGRPDLPQSPKFRDRFVRVDNMLELDQLIEDWTSVRSRWELVKVLQAHGVPCAPVQSVEEVANDPHLIERGMIRYVNHPTKGKVPVPGSPIRLSESSVGEVGAAPSLGADTDSFLATTLGYSPEQISRLRASGAIH